jgi:triosephosphate isomerase
MRKPIIAGNWKMNTTLNEARTLVKTVAEGLPELIDIDIVVCPPFISIASVKDVINGVKIQVGAQNLYYEEKGAFTGEVSPLMLKDLCSYVIVGHSERRQLFYETNQSVSRKIKVALKYDLKPIVCVGENLDEFESGQTGAVVTGQISGSLEGVNSLHNITIAYEPIWAIGTGRAATAAQANQAIRLIRETLAMKYDQASAEKTRILYGGSVTSANIRELMNESDIDGGLVGGASLKAGEFLDIIKTTNELAAARNKSN